MEEAGTDPVRWRIAFPDRVRVVRLADAAIVFNPLSWQTHYLNEAAYCVFETLRAGPMTVDALVDETVDAAERLSSRDRAEWAHILSRHLDELAAMGLAARDADAIA